MRSPLPPPTLVDRIRASRKKHKPLFDWIGAEHTARNGYPWLLRIPLPLWIARPRTWAESLEFSQPRDRPLELKDYEWALSFSLTSSCPRWASKPESIFLPHPFPSLAIKALISFPKQSIQIANITIPKYLTSCSKYLTNLFPYDFPNPFPTLSISKKAYIVSSGAQPLFIRSIPSSTTRAFHQQSFFLFLQ